MEKISTVRDLVAKWPTRLHFAQAIGVPVDRVHKWAASNTIPPKYHRSVMTAVTGLGLDFTADDLIDLHSAQGAAA